MDMGHNRKKTPPLSVVMPVHNAISFLHESIPSILNQTFTDFEFIILDDASTDGSLKALREWEKKDSRIHVFRSDRNLGLAASSNAVVAKSRAPLVARMDADDISHRDRLRRQLEVFESRSDVAAVGTLYQGIDVGGRVTRPRDRWRIIRHSQFIPFPHGSAMFRRDVFNRIEGYDEQLLVGEDQQIFYKMFAVGKVVTLPDVLYYFRYHADNSTLATGGAGLRAAAGNAQNNGHDLAALHLLGAMRLWAGQSPRILPELIARKALHLNLRSLLTLSSATLGSISPAALRFMLRFFIRARDGMAGLTVRDGRPYEWRLK
jgi:glycosyltransferase involved in cell wall biosynthesis